MAALFRKMILAINRAERLKLLCVTLVFGDFQQSYFQEVGQNFPEAIVTFTPNFEKALLLGYKDTALPLLRQMKRAALTTVAEQAAVDMFASNLKQLLLMSPVKNQCILGIDPGTSLGCKLGLISQNGAVLATGIVHPSIANNQQQKRQKEKVRNMLMMHQCSLIAIGNGTGCRVAEEWIASMITQNYFFPLRVFYTIVNESGVSIYSCSAEAISEFGKLNPNLIGAISIARRLQDPLSELVKVEPRHLGIGMYQHDVDPKRLEAVLADVICECVSFVGVDINTASQCLLRHVAGLSDTLAHQIISHRGRNGGFTNRKEIYEIPGIGSLTYKQCASFLRILNGANRLDETAVHPESYDMVRAIVKRMGMQMHQIGKNSFRLKLRQQHGVLMSAHRHLGTSREHLQDILDGLAEPVDLDNHSHTNRQPLYRQDIRHINGLHVGATLTGAVVNVTMFGSFVDIGVAANGLIHVDNARGVQLQIGDRVLVEVCHLDKGRKRIGLELLRLQ